MVGPSIPGIIQSRMAIGGASGRVSAFQASVPFLATRTSCPHFSRALCRIRSDTGSSSATSTRGNSGIASGCLSTSDIMFVLWPCRRSILLDFLQRLGQDFQGEGFFQELRTAGFHRLLPDPSGTVSGGKYDSDLRVDSLEPGIRFQPAHSRHDQVKQYALDALAFPGIDFAGFAATFGCFHFITQAAQSL